MKTFFSPEELSEYLSVPLNTVYAWRRKRIGPAGHVIGKHVRYRIADVDSWVESQ